MYERESERCHGTGRVNSPIFARGIDSYECSCHEDNDFLCE